MEITYGKRVSPDFGSLTGAKSGSNLNELVLVPTVNTGETYHLRYDVKDTVSPKLRQRKAHHPLKLDTIL